MKPTKSDSLILIGLILLATGLFFWWGKGVALTIVGAIVVVMGVAGNISESPNVPTGRKGVTG